MREPLTLSSYYITSLLSSSSFARSALDIQLNVDRNKQNASKAYFLLIFILENATLRPPLLKYEMRSLSLRASEWIQARGVSMDTLCRPANQEAPSDRRLETGPDGTDCVDELLISLSFTKTERNFRSGSAECKQTVERRCTGRKEECECYLARGSYTSCSGYTLELRLVVFLFRPAAVCGAWYAADVL